MKGRSDREILNVAQQEGMRTIFEDGIQKILEGLTTLEEVTRVIAPPRPPSGGISSKSPVLLVKKKKSSG